MNALQANDRVEINQSLKPYKTQQGHSNYPALLSIPSSERLPAMAANEPKKTLGLLIVGLTMAFETMNLNRPMNSSQIFELAETLIDTSSEDNLSLEDIFLFLQKLTRGEYGSLYESMDIPKFMEKFEVYRECRHLAMRNLRDEENARYSIDRTEPRNSDTMQREESIKNTAALINYELNKKA